MAEQLSGQVAIVTGAGRGIGRAIAREVARAGAAVARPGLPRYASAYIVSKTALLRFTEALAAEVQEHGIQVFVISPGPVQTDMTDYLINSEAGLKWGPAGWSVQRRLWDEGRLVPPELAAQLILLLASGQFDALSGCYVDALEDLAALRESAGDERVQASRKLGLALYQSA